MLKGMLNAAMKAVLCCCSDLVSLLINLILQIERNGMQMRSSETKSKQKQSTQRKMQLLNNENYVVKRACALLCCFFLKANR